MGEALEIRPIPNPLINYFFFGEKPINNFSFSIILYLTIILITHHHHHP